MTVAPGGLARSAALERELDEVGLPRLLRAPQPFGVGQPVLRVHLVLEAAHERITGGPRPLGAVTRAGPAPVGGNA